jgi:hypothetical protein
MRYILLTIVLLFGGCSYRSDYSRVSNKQTSEQGVANTKKIQLPIGGKPKIFVTVTYLNSIQNKDFVDKNLEQFVVGIHNVGLSPKEKKISQKDMKFSIEDSADFASVKKLKANDKILDIVPASNPWSTYYLVQTPIIDKNIIKFSFEIHPFLKASLTFEKDY